ncbi:glycosyltransferase family 2 protein [Subsaximicrobium wynnwilliamsii]|uniref:Glycosyltransferase family 2 protein n=2 Tax=Subsaximicrobium wynnwilliamsii TaxID=291179 RepID=A0A5C6ZKB2_9FLAO|nr:glycosyltransferase family 2 protein [Subsaximicrobium wynnwilliamsii]TXD90654.1 glycosyltransferase family 2 protein [Subsaximicrobium wynnwilliamsii]TXE05129.1 glycosyltransferase family 2 protein [Subsaximicrobium wynnwilliamsii]
MITYNEIGHIKEAISNLEFADEIIVIDSFSTDGTFEALSTMNHVKIVQRAFQNFADQRNFAIDQATRDWIFFMDADERLTQASQEEIVETVKHNNGIEAFKIPRRFMFNDKMMRFSGLQTDRVFRLFKRGVTKYRKDKLVHEVLDFTGEFAVLTHEMLHYSFSDYESYKKKTEHYGCLKAQELFKKGKTPNAFHFYIKPAYKFLANYVFRLGFLDGREGYTICSLNAYGVFFRYKVLEKLLSGAPE